ASASAFFCRVSSSQVFFLNATRARFRYDRTVLLPDGTTVQITAKAPQKMASERVSDPIWPPIWKWSLASLPTAAATIDAQAGSAAVEKKSTGFRGVSLKAKMRDGYRIR